MGRIEDALRKLQESTKRQPPNVRWTSSRATEARSRSLATVASGGGGDYRGSFIEVDLEALKAQGLLAPDSEQQLLAEQYRTIKRPLLRNADPDRGSPLLHGNLLMVASALPGEGKTFTCVNLCLSIAREKDWSVVLVDADCSKSDLTRLFAAENEPGLIDLLRDESLSLESVVMPTSIRGLSLIPAGKRDEHAPELLASHRMESICERLSVESGSRVTVFDSSPLLFTTEAIGLAAHVGQIVVVVRANETPQHAVFAALEKLDPAKAIACVLNQAYEAELGLGYGDRYGYVHEDTGQRGA